MPFLRKTYSLWALLFMMIPAWLSSQDYQVWINLNSGPDESIHPLSSCTFRNTYEFAATMAKLHADGKIVMYWDEELKRPISKDSIWVAFLRQNEISWNSWFDDTYLDPIMGLVRNTENSGFDDFVGDELWGFEDEEPEEKKSLPTYSFQENPYLYLLKNVDWSNTLISFREKWSMNGEDIAIIQEVGALEFEDPGETFPSKFFYFDPNDPNVPYEMTMRRKFNSFQEETARDIIQNRKFDAKLEGIRPYGSPRWIPADRSSDRNYFYRNRRRDSLMQVLGYLEAIDSYNNISEKYPIQTKGVQIYLTYDRDRTLSVEQQNAVPDAFYQANNTLFSQSIKQILDLATVGKIAVYNSDSVRERVQVNILKNMKEIEGWLDYDEEPEPHFDDFERSDEKNSNDSSQFDTGFDDFEGTDDFEWGFVDTEDTVSTDSPINADELSAIEEAQQPYSVDYDAYLGVCTIDGILKREAGKIRFTPEVLNIIWEDPGRTLPQKVVASILFEDIEKNGILCNGVSLAKFIESLQFYYFPLRVNNNGVTTIQQALHLKQLLLSGEWEAIPNRY